MENIINFLELIFWSVLIISMALLFSALSVSVLIKTIISARDSRHKIVSVQKQNNLTILFNCDVKQYQEAMNIIHSLPGAMTYIFQLTSFSIFFFSHNEYMKYSKEHGIKNAERYAGYFSPCDNAIIVNCACSDMRNTIFHEFGHFVDYLRGKKSYYSLCDKQLIAEFEKNKNFNVINIPSYYLSSPIEFLAWCVSYRLEGDNSKLSPIMGKLADEYLSSCYSTANDICMVIDSVVGE